MPFAPMPRFEPSVPPPYFATKAEMERYREWEEGRQKRNNRQGVIHIAWVSAIMVAFLGFVIWKSVV